MSKPRTFGSVGQGEQRVEVGACKPESREAVSEEIGNKGRGLGRKLSRG